MDAATLRAATGCTVARANLFAEPLTRAMQEFQIDTPARQAAFVAQTAHESILYTHTRELWGPTLAQTRYEGRADLGNTQPGDGFRFRGRGLIQITGRANYAAAGKALGIDLVADPGALEEPDLAAVSAAWWWLTHGCNALADAAAFEQLTRKINGGLTGIDKRRALWDQAKGVLQA